MNLSVVIITKNEAHNIGRCIKSCLPLGAEILVIDSHSTDDTVSIAERLGATVHTRDWKGYGATKNEGARLASYDWVLSLDADEALDKTIQKSIQDFTTTENNFLAYWLARSLVFNKQQLIYGAVKGEKRLRLYHKNTMQWNLNEVHEDLEKIDKKDVVFYGQLDGNIMHYSYSDLEDMRARLDKYAKLSAKKLEGKSKLYLTMKRIVAPSFSFLKNYFFRMGILDGKEGLLFAREQANYVRNKYKYALIVDS